MNVRACLVLALLATAATYAHAAGGYLETCTCGATDACNPGLTCAQTVQQFTVQSDGLAFIAGVGAILVGGTPTGGTIGTLTNRCYTAPTPPAAGATLPRGPYNFEYNPDFCPACPTGGCGDPIITGYDGRAFDFKGEADKFFNLISDPNHLVNAKFVDAELQNEVGNFMGEIGFKYMNSTVKAAINHEGIMTVEVNGEEQPFAQVTKDLGDGLLVEIEPHFPQLGHVVVITTPLMVFRVEAIKPFDDEITGHNRGYINVLSILRDHPSGLHGILGQTAYTTEYYPLNDMQFHGDGGEMDYAVSSLFAHDFKYNTFTFTGLTKSADSSRRLLVASTVAENRVVVDSATPLMAGHSSLAKHFM